MAALDFNAALERLYREFRVPKPASIDACPCCLDSEDVCTLLARDLRSIAPHELSSYASSVFLTCGSAPDFRYFLPRIFEIAATDRDWWPSPEVAIGKLQRAEWQHWSSDERSAVRTFLMAWLDCEARLAATGPDTYDTPVDDLLCGIALAGEDLAPYLERMLRYPPALAAVYAVNASSIATQRKLSNAFWAHRDERGQPLLNFLVSDRVQRRIQDA
jgi:hypothetical protein